VISKYLMHRIECILQRRPLTVMHKTFDLWTDFFARRSRLPQWLLANKMLLSEGIDKLRATGIWDLNFEEAADTGKDIFNSGLLHPSSATVVRAHFPISAADKFDKMAKELQIITNLKELDITMSVWSLQDRNPYRGINLKKPIKWDMHSLAIFRERFPGLQSLTIHLTCVSPLRYPFVPQAYTKELCADAVKAIKEAVGPTFGKNVKIESEIYLSKPSNEQMMLTFERK
jgi:hypothetical protein